MSTQGKYEQDVNTVVDKAQDKAEQMGDEAKQQAKRVASQVGDQAKSSAETRKKEVAEDLGSVADAVRQTAREVDASPTVMEYGQKVADQIEGVSSYLNEHGVEDILADVEDFGRRKPAVFLGGAFMLGLLVGRFLRSSSSRVSEYESLDYDSYQRDYRDPGYTGYTGRSQTGYQSRTTYPTGTTTTTTGRLNTQD
jgi:vacuolar-type H+-ATPase subunit H